MSGQLSYKNASMRFHKQADNMNHGTCIGCHSWNESIFINQINEKS